MIEMLIVFGPLLLVGLWAIARGWGLSIAAFGKPSAPNWDTSAWYWCKPEADTAGAFLVDTRGKVRGSVWRSPSGAWNAFTDMPLGQYVTEHLAREAVERAYKP